MSKSKGQPVDAVTLAQLRKLYDAVRDETLPLAERRSALQHACAILDDHSYNVADVAEGDLRTAAGAVIGWTQSLGHGLSLGDAMEVLVEARIKAERGW